MIKDINCLSLIKIQPFRHVELENSLKIYFDLFTGFSRIFQAFVYWRFWHFNIMTFQDLSFSRFLIFKIFFFEIFNFQDCDSLRLSHLMFWSLWIIIIQELNWIRSHIWYLPKCVYWSKTQTVKNSIKIRYFEWSTIVYWNSFKKHYNI